ncbi:hypothetical protein [Burkholderia vietnamiensis]|uniref:hypothetical protein n=1 Tax=Burkholderia vietnamiensis TaxID=60552 RepID=UPI001CB12E75|nr:hypothetical protein BVI1335_70186 [Burkholderia vietnamiensis]
MKSADEVVVTAQWVVCPHCGQRQDGWLVDPRGNDHECDECGQTYRVPDDAAIKFF